MQKEQSTIPFHKYQGAGNDFVMIDNRTTKWVDPADSKTINWLCDRRFGIGGDGLILLQNHPTHDLEMVYFNSDGTEGSMCGNGGRCFVAYAHALGLIKGTCVFMAVDGVHEASINEAGDWVELKMIDVQEVTCHPNHYVMNTGSPHYVTFVPKVKEVKVFQEGQAIRYSDAYAKEGINVNFVEATPKGIDIATYERGVEDETLACGTGVTAAAISYFIDQPKAAIAHLKNGGIPIKAKGGQLNVRFEVKNNTFHNIWLCGPAKAVFKGNIVKI